MSDDIDLTPDAVERLAKRVLPILLEETRTVTLFASTAGEVAGTLRALSARLAEVDSELDKLKESEEFLERCAVVSEKRWESANAKLTKATDALREIAKDEIYPPGYGRDPEQSRCAKTARTTLAEIGEGHE
jgi:hypothetical protein